jgi:uncharacterized LabA/DUF88 family protein
MREPGLPQSMQKVAIFVDVQNIYYTMRQAYNSHFDYNAFWRRVTADRTVVRATAFAIERGDPKQRQFQDVLRGIGFEVKLKPFISRADGSAKGDWDVGITLDMLDSVDEAEVIVLASGDGDFDILVQRLRQRHGIQVEVYGVDSLTAGTLKRAASRFVPIDDALMLRPNDASAPRD